MAKTLTQEEIERRIMDRLHTYPALSRSFVSTFLLGSTQNINAALKHLMSLGTVKSVIVPTGNRDIVQLYYLSDQAHLVEPIFEQNKAYWEERERS